MTGSAFAYEDQTTCSWSDNIVLTGPKDQVRKVLGEIDWFLEGSRICVHEGEHLPLELVFNASYKESRRAKISSIPISQRWRILSEESLALIQAWQGLDIREEYRSRCTDDMFPVQPAKGGIAIHAYAPLGYPYWEPKNKGDQAKLTKEIRGPNHVVPLECDPHRIPKSEIFSRMPAGVVQIWTPGDGSTETVDTKWGLYIREEYLRLSR